MSNATNTNVTANATNTQANDNGYIAYVLRKEKNMSNWKKTNEGAHDAYTNGEFTVVKVNQRKWQIAYRENTFVFKTKTEAIVLAESGLEVHTQKEADEVVKNARAEIERVKAEQKEAERRMKEEAEKKAEALIQEAFENMAVVELSVPDELDVMDAVGISLAEIEDEDFDKRGKLEMLKKKQKAADDALREFRALTGELEIGEDDEDIIIPSATCLTAEEGMPEYRQAFRKVQKTREELRNAEADCEDMHSKLYSGDTAYVMVRFKTESDYRVEACAGVLNAIDAKIIEKGKNHEEVTKEDTALLKVAQKALRSAIKEAREASEKAGRFAFDIGLEIDCANPTRSKTPAYNIAERVNKKLFGENISGIAKTVVYFNVEKYQSLTMLAESRAVAKKTADNSVQRQGTNTQWNMYWAARKGDWEHPDLSELSATATDAYAYVMASPQVINDAKEIASKLINVGQVINTVAPKDVKARDELLKQFDVSEKVSEELKETRKWMRRTSEELDEAKRALDTAHKEFTEAVEKNWSVDRSEVLKLEDEKRAIEEMIVANASTSLRAAVNSSPEVVKIREEYEKACKAEKDASDAYSTAYKALVEAKYEADLKAEREEVGKAIKGSREYAREMCSRLEEAFEKLRVVKRIHRRVCVWAEEMETIVKPFENVRITPDMTDEDKKRLCEYMDAYDEACELVAEHNDKLTKAYKDVEKARKNAGIAYADYHEERKREVYATKGFVKDDVTTKKLWAELCKARREKKRLANEVSGQLNNAREMLVLTIGNRSEDVVKLREKMKKLEDAVGETKLAYDDAKNVMDKAFSRMESARMSLDGFKGSDIGELEKLENALFNARNELGKAIDDYTEASRAKDRAIRAYEGAHTGDNDKASLADKIRNAEHEAIVEFYTSKELSIKLGSCRKSLALAKLKVAAERKKARANALNNEEVKQAYAKFENAIIAEKAAKANALEAQTAYKAISQALLSEVVRYRADDGFTMITRGAALEIVIDAVTRLKSATNKLEKAKALDVLSHAAYRFVNNYLGEQRAIRDDGKYEKISLEEIDEYIADPRSIAEDSVSEFEVRRRRIVRAAAKELLKELTPAQIRALNALYQASCEQNYDRRITRAKEILGLKNHSTIVEHIANISEIFSEVLTRVAPDSYELELANLARLTSKKSLEEIELDAKLRKERVAIARKKDGVAELAKKAIESLEQKRMTVEEEEAIRRAITSACYTKFTPSMLKIAIAIGDDKTQREIANEMGISQPAVLKAKNKACELLAIEIISAVSNLKNGESIAERVEKLRDAHNLKALMSLAA